MAVIDVKKMTCNLFAEDPAIETRIRDGIEKNRKGNAGLELVREDGTQVTRARVRCTQLSHDFLFGCNAFLYHQFESREENARHDDFFTNLFNLAVIPFYWKDLEPEKGHPRFEKESVNIYRRPAPGLVLEFCRAHGIVPKGHVLAWHHPNMLPSWLPSAPEEIAHELERRIREIAERFGAEIPFWDVANEALGYRGTPVMPGDFVRLAFELADRYFPKSAKLFYNENDWRYFSYYTPLYMMIRQLQCMGCRLDALGLQFHMFGSGAVAESFSGDMLSPERVYNVLDLMSSAGIPLHISEVTILGSAELGDGEEVQARVLDKMYRIWFSHPAVQAAIYWNLVDDCTFVRKGWDENIFKGGLLHRDLTPKKAYRALENLIRREWHTDCTVDYDCRKENAFRGFYGKYRLDIETESGTVIREIAFPRGGGTHFRIVV